MRKLDRRQHSHPMCTSSRCFKLRRSISTIVRTTTPQQLFMLRQRMTRKIIPQHLLLKRRIDPSHRIARQQCSGKSSARLASSGASSLVKRLKQTLLPPNDDPSLLPIHPPASARSNTAIILRPMSTHTSRIHAGLDQRFDRRPIAYAGDQSRSVEIKQIRGTVRSSSRSAGNRLRRCTRHTT